MDPISPKDFVSFIKQTEGFREKPYQDVNGHWTVGYGHKIAEGEDFSEGISEEQANTLLARDLKHHYSRTREFFDEKHGGGAFDKLGNNDRLKLVGIDWNAGIREFPKFVDAVAKGDIEAQLAEYKTYADGVELGRNAHFRDLFYGKSESEGGQGGAASEEGQAAKSPLGELMRDPEFLQLSPESQIGKLVEVSPSFGELYAKDKQKALEFAEVFRRTAQNTQGEDPGVLESLGGGWDMGIGYAILTAANAAKIIEDLGIDNDLDDSWRNMAYARIAEGQKHVGSDWQDTLAAIAGGLPGGLAIPGLATAAAFYAAPPILAAAGVSSATATAIGTAAAPVLGFGASGFVGAYDQGFKEAAKRGAIDAALGAIYPATAHLGRLSRAAISGGAAYAASEQEGDMRGIEAAAVAVLEGLPGRRPPFAVMQKLFKLDDPVKAKVSAVIEARRQLEQNAASIAARREIISDADGKPIGSLEDAFRAYGDVVDGAHPVTWDPDERTPWQMARIQNRGVESKVDPRPVRSSNPDEVKPGDTMVKGRFDAEFNPGPTWTEKRRHRVSDDLKRSWFQKKAINPQEIITQFARAMKLPIHADLTMKQRRQGTGGFTYPQSWRTNADRTDIQTAAHEMGHQFSWWDDELMAHHSLINSHHTLRPGGKAARPSTKLIQDLQRLDAIASHHGIHQLGDTYQAIGTPTKTGLKPPTAGTIFELNERGLIPDDIKYLPELMSQSYDRDNLTEGMAEAFKNYLTNDSRLGGTFDFKAAAPHVDKLIEGWTKRLPREQRKAVEKFRRDAHRYFDQDAELAMRGSMGAGGADPSTVLSGASASIRQTAFDDFAGIMNMERQVWGKQLPDGVYEAFRLLRGAAEAASRMIDLGAPVWVLDKNAARQGLRRRHMIRYEGKGIADIFGSNGVRSRRKMRMALQYSTAVQSKELSEQMILANGRMMNISGLPDANKKQIQSRGLTREKLFTPEQIEAGLKLGEQYPEFKQIHKELREFATKMADFGEFAGLWSKTQRDSWQRHEFVFSFLREMEERASRGIRTAALLTGKPTTRLRGSTRRLRDPVQLLMETHTRTFTMAMENVAKAQLAEFVARTPSAGRYGRIVKEIPKLKEFDIRAVAEALRRELLNNYPGIESQMIDTMLKDLLKNPDEVTRITMFIGNQKPFGDNILTYFQSGRAQYLQVDDPTLLRAVQSIRRPELLGFLKVWNGLREWKQRWITRGPGFMFANLWRDAAMASVMSRTGHIHFGKAVRGLVGALRQDQDYRDFIANGGGGAGVRMTLQDTERLMIQHARKTGFDPRRLIITPMSALRALDSIGRNLEIASRLGEYKAARKKGASARHAAYLGREVSTDFAMRGDSRNLQFLTNTIPFFNAMMVGGDRLYRGVFYDPSNKMATVMKMSMVAMASAALYSINRQIAQYQDLPQWDKDGYWHFFAPKWTQDGDRVRVTEGRFAGQLDYDHFKLPKLWEVGLFGSVAERFLQSGLGDEDEETAGLFVSLMHLVTQNFGIQLEGRAFPLPVPVGADLIVEQFSNKVLSTGNPIESQARANQEHWSRTRDRGPRVFGEYGKLVRETPIGDTPFASPARAEALLRGMFGEFVALGAAAVDEMFWPGRPAMRTDQIPGVSRFYEGPGKYSKQEDLFYERRKMIAQTAATLPYLAKRPAEADTLEEWIDDPEKGVRIGAESMMDRADAMIAAINEQIRLIESGDMGLVGEEATKARDELIEERREVMATLNKAMEEISKRVGE